MIQRPSSLVYSTRQLTLAEAKRVLPSEQQSFLDWTSLNSPTNARGFFKDTMSIKSFNISTRTVTVKPLKCEFHVLEVSFLELIVSKGNL